MIFDLDEQKINVKYFFKEIIKICVFILLSMTYENKSYYLNNKKIQTWISGLKSKSIYKI